MVSQVNIITQQDMPNIKQTIVLCGSSALLAATLGLTGCASNERPLSQRWDDKATAMRVEHQLNKSPLYKFEDVQVTAYNGQVQLSGFAFTEQEKHVAGDIARETEGVASVINDIAIKPGTPVPTGRAYDQYQQRMQNNNPPPPAPAAPQSNPPPNNQQP